MDSLSHVMEFSEDHKLFAYIDDSGKLKIWDTETNQLKQEYVPNLHLISPITCLKWIEISTGKSGKTPEKRKRQEKKLYIALGTNTGKVAIYSYGSGEIERNLEGRGHSNAVTDLFYDSENQMIYSCGADSKVIKWSLNDGGKQLSTVVDCGKSKPTALTVFENYIVTAGKNIKLWNADTGSCIKTFTGHSGFVTILQIFIHQTQTFCVSVAKTEHIIAVWCLDDEPANNEPVLSFTADSSDIINISLNVFDGKLKLTAVNQRGDLSLYDCNLSKIKPGKAAKPVKRKCKIQIVDTVKQNVTEPISIVAAKLHFGVHEILVAYGDRMLLCFEKLTPDLSKSEILIARENPKKIKKSEDAASDKPHNLVVPLVEKDQVEYLNVVTSTRKAGKITDIPLQTRLENISISVDGKAPKNMSHLLIQGLHSKDAAILRTVFQITDVEAIGSTLRKLPPQYVKPLVDELSSLMQKKTVHVQSSVIWLKLLIESHISQLMALGPENLKNMFSICLGIIDHRLVDLPALMNLRGRFDLVVNRLTSQNSSQLNDDLDTSQLLIYEENSDQEDLLLKDEESDAHQEWDEEESDLDEESSEDETQIHRKNLNNSKNSQDDDLEEDEEQEEMDVSD